MTQLVFKIIGYLGWLTATALGIGGSWFWNFTKPDENDPNLKRLTLAGKRAIYVMAVSMTCAIASTTYNEISSHYKAKDLADENARLKRLYSNIIQRDSTAGGISPKGTREIPRMLPSGAKLSVIFGVPCLVIHGPIEDTTLLSSIGRRVLQDLPNDPDRMIPTGRGMLDVSHLIKEESFRGYIVVDGDIPIIGPRNASHSIVIINSTDEFIHGKIFYEWTELFK